MSVKNELINLIPESNELWRGIGGHFDSLSQVLCEFIDNSISNFRAHNTDQKNIYIDLIECDNNDVEVTIEDTGLGIKNLKSALKLGSKDNLETPMNEHGFGMKHALATANLENDNWEIYTRTEEHFKKGTYIKLSSPYKLQGFSIEEKNYKSWPGKYNKTGTIIKFICKKDLYRTLTKGLKGHHGFRSQTNGLIEDLGFIYSELIKKGVVLITVDHKGKNKKKKEREMIKALEPNWAQYIGPKSGEEKVNLGSGQVTIEYQFGLIKDSTYRKYYRNSMGASGVEIKLNGRVIEHNIFTEVWGKDRHNSYNKLLIILNIKSDDRNRLPMTKSSKNGLRQGDPKLSKIFEWIRVKLPEPQKNRTQYDNEQDLFKELERLKNHHIPDPKEVQRERPVFTSLKDPAYLDFFIAVNGKYIIYEGKRNKTTIQDAYQLKMYWDGCVLDGIEPYEGHLIAQEHPDSVKEIIMHINEMLDIKGNEYNLKLTYWKDETIEIMD